MAFESTLGSSRPASTSLERDRPQYPGLDDSPTMGQAQPGLYQGSSFIENLVKGIRQPLTATVAQPATPVPMQQANPLSGIMDFLTAFNGPTIQGFQNQQSRLTGLQAATDANFTAQKGFMGQGNKLDHALLALQRQGIGIQQKGNQAEYGFLDRLRNLAGQGFGNQQAQINEKAEQQHRATKNDFVGRGATVAVEHGLQHQDIDQETAQAIEAARLGYEKELVGFDQQKARLDQAGEMLGLDLQKLGLNGQQLDLQLQMGLANLGLDQLMSTDEFWSKIETSQGQEAQFWMDLFSQVFQWGQMGDAMKMFGY